MTSFHVDAAPRASDRPPVNGGREAAVRVTAGFIGVMSLAAAVLFLVVAADGEPGALLPGVGMLAGALLFGMIAFTGQHSRASVVLFVTVGGAAAAIYLLIQLAPLLHLPAAYSAIALVLGVAVVLNLRYVHPPARAIVAVAQAAAALALARYRGRLGPYAGPLPDFFDTVAATWMAPLYAAGLGALALVYWQKRKA